MRKPIIWIVAGRSFRRVVHTKAAVRDELARRQLRIRWIARASTPLANRVRVRVSS